MTSGIPIDWLPTNPSKNRGGPSPFVTYWKAPQADLLSTASPQLRSFFLSEGIDPQSQETRHMWSTAAYIEAAGLRYFDTRTGRQWIRPEDAAQQNGADITPFDFVAIEFALNADGSAQWKIASPGSASHIRLFRVLDEARYRQAMVDYLHAILSQSPSSQ
jgi:hypothetical protein